LILPFSPEFRFAFTVSFHIIFPPMSIGLASSLAVSEAVWLRTKNPVYLQIYKFWLGIFAMGFGIGAVTGIVLPFEFGLGLLASPRWLDQRRTHNRPGSDCRRVKPHLRLFVSNARTLSGVIRRRMLRSSA
jgi:Cytochrome bd terminal oxidase subunit I